MAEDLPATIPIFPLAGVLLLPGGHLPLNIFEPRYLQMVKDAMAGSKLIGMIQPTDPTTRQFEPPVYPMGCVGRISQFKETPDNRFLITLTGERRFTIQEELARTTLYRQVRVSYEHEAPVEDGAPEQAVDRKRLLAGLKGYLERSGLRADWASIEQAPTGPLVTTLAMVCPFEPSEKQAFLEAGGLAQRAKLMTALIEMSLMQTGGAGKPKTPLN